MIGPYGAWPAWPFFVPRGALAPDLDSPILALAPYSWPRLSYYSLDGVSGKVSAILESIPTGTGIRAAYPSHSYAQATSANQVAVPTAQASLNNALAGNFNTAPYYVSTAPASAWIAPHNGAGFTAIWALDRLSVSGTQYPWATYGGAETGAAFYYSGAGLGAAVYNGAALTLNATASDEATGATFHSALLASANTPDMTARRRTASIATADASTGFAAGNPVHTMSLGAFESGANPINAYMAEWQFYDRALTSGELTIVHNYIAAKYGLS